MAKNCTCSLLQETIDKIFIDDSCCCQNTVVTPTNNCCSCEPIIDLIDTDKFACPSFDNSRNLKYELIKESWLEFGTESKAVYNAIINAQASDIMLLLKVLGGIGTRKDCIIAPIEISKDGELELYIIKYFKFIEDKLNVCTYTTHKEDEDNYTVSWNSDLLDEFDASLYYTKTECDNNFNTIILNITNNYNTISESINNFYTKEDVYTKNEVDAKILWEVGEGQYSTQRIETDCEARGDYSFATGADNTVNGEGSVAMGIDNTITGNLTFAAGNSHRINGNINTITGYKNEVQGLSNFMTGSNSKIIGNYSGTIGDTNEIQGNYNFIGGYNNKINKNYNFTYGTENEITDGECSAVFGFDNCTEKGYSLTSGSHNKITSDNSTALGAYNNITKSTSFAAGLGNQVNKEYGAALNECNRATGIANIAGGRRSYTANPVSCAIGTPVAVDYYIRLVNSNDPQGTQYENYFALTDSNGNLVNIPENSIQDLRFNFLVDQKPYGELAIELTDNEKNTKPYNVNFPDGGAWPQLSVVKEIIDNDNRYLYFSIKDTLSMYGNIISLFNTTGIRKVSYASGFDGCKAVEIGAHAEGYGTIASGIGSHSEGVDTITKNMGEHACGKYNYSTENQTLFSVGIGSQNSILETVPKEGLNIKTIRKNALEITNDGDIYIRVKTNSDETLYNLGELLKALISKTELLDDDYKVQGRSTEEANYDHTTLTFKEY